MGDGTNWANTTLGEIGRWFGGSTPSKANPAYWSNGTMPWVSPKDMKTSQIVDSVDHISKAALDDRNQAIVPIGSVLVVIRSGILSHTLPVATTHVLTTINQDLKAVCPVDGIDTEFVAWFLRSHQHEILSSCSKSGTTVASINLPDLLAVEIPTPCGVEQAAIVEKLETLFSELDQGVELLATIQQQLKRYRQAVLKAAFEGKLTAEWRSQQSELPSADELLKQIQGERRERYTEQVAQWEQAVGEWEAAGGKDSDQKKPRKPAKPKDLPPMSEDELAELPELPEGWAWCRPPDICSPEPYSLGIGPFGSNLKVPDYTKTGVPLIFVKNITRFIFKDFVHHVSQEKADELLPHSVKPLDVLITKMGEPPGDVAIYPATCPPAILTADCVKFRVWDQFVSREFVASCIESALVKKQLGLITKGVAQKKISLGRFKAIFLPACCRQEQLEIVDQLSSRFSVIDELETAVSAGLKQSKALRQSILKMAFEGRLLSEPELAAVRADPAYEPAEQLLERIKAEREQAKAAKPKRKIKAKAKKTGRKSKAVGSKK